MTARTDEGDYRAAEIGKALSDRELRDLICAHAARMGADRPWLELYWSMGHGQPDEYALVARRANGTASMVLTLSFSPRYAFVALRRPRKRRHDILGGGGWVIPRRPITERHLAHLNAIAQSVARSALVIAARRFHVGGGR